MFKLIKILNRGTNVPEPIRLNKGARAIVRGEAFVLTGGKVTSPSATTLPTHIALCEADADDTTAICAQICPEMVFECPVKDGTPSSLVVGNKVCLALEGGSALGVNTTTTSGVATVYDTLGATNIGDKILITFR